MLKIHRKSIGPFTFDLGQQDDALVSFICEVDNPGLWFWVHLGFYNTYVSFSVDKEWMTELEKRIYVQDGE